MGPDEQRQKERERSERAEEEEKKAVFSNSEPSRDGYHHLLPPVRDLMCSGKGQDFWK